MIGDGEAVRLLLNAADQRKDRRDALNADLAAVRRDEGARAVAVVLDHAEDRQLELHGRERLAHRLGMDGAAVDQQRVRALVEALVAVEIVAEAAADDLPHGRVIVLLVHIFELKALVIAFFRFPVDKNHH